MKELDIDGLHGLIVCLQRSTKFEAQTHLSNLGRFVTRFGDKDWYQDVKANGVDFKSFLNDEAPLIPLESEWWQIDPTFKMFRNVLHIVMEGGLND